MKAKGIGEITLNSTDIKKLLEKFDTCIFSNGLYKEADESTKKTLVSDEDGIYIGSLWMCGRIMVTVSQGQEVDAHYCQITFMASSDEPDDLFVKSHDGTYRELMDMLVRASERFGQGRKVMKEDSLIYAGVTIG